MAIIVTNRYPRFAPHLTPGLSRSVRRLHRRRSSAMGSQSAAKPHPELSKPMRRDHPLPQPLPPPPPPPQNPNPSVPSPSPAAPAAAATASDSSALSSSLCAAADDDPALAATALLSREEVLRRRSRRLKRLERLYRDQYWALAEEARSKHREYYWNYGLSPTSEEREAAGNSGADAAAGEEEGGGENRVMPVSQRSQCVFAGCKSKAMPFTRFCHPHILSDRNQTLYKACSYAIKSGQSGPITCGKPVLMAAIPSLCSLHLQKAQKHISHALKKAGFNPSSSSRGAPKFHVIITEFLQQIQSKRRDAPNALTESNAELDRNVS